MSGITDRDEKGRIKKGGSFGGKTGTSWKPLEERDPETFAEFVALIAEDPETTFARLADAVGLTSASASAIAKRITRDYGPVVEEAKRVTTDSLVKQIESKLPILLDAITVEKVNASALREIAVAFGVLAEKRQLLKGEPTQILTYEERQNISDLLPTLLKEAERRGMVVDATFREVPDVQVIPPDRLPDEALSKTAAGMAKRERRAQNR